MWWRWVTMLVLAAGSVAGWDYYKERKVDTVVPFVEYASNAVTVCRKAMSAPKWLADQVLDSILKRKVPGHKFPQCLLACTLKQLDMIGARELGGLLLPSSGKAFLSSLGEMDRHKAFNCFHRVNNRLLHHCTRAMYFLVCFNS